MTTKKTTEEKLRVAKAAWDASLIKLHAALDEYVMYYNKYRAVGKESDRALSALRKIQAVADRQKKGKRS